MRPKGKVAIVTGAAQGIGLATARKFFEEGAIVAMVGQVRARDGRVDVLVNNGGITRNAPLQKMTDEQFGQVIAVNLDGTHNRAQAVIDTMVTQGFGVMLDASSVVGLHGNYGQTDYAASKFGVIGFVKTWAREPGPEGIRCHALCQGFIATSILHTIPDKVMAQMTERVSLKRLGRPQQLADSYGLLATECRACRN